MEIGDFEYLIKTMKSQRLLQDWHNVIYLKQYFGWPDQSSSGLDVTNL